MTEFIVKRIGKVPKLTNPVLIEGLPGIGNVARLSVDYLIDKLGAKKFCEVYSDVFPNSVTINEKSVVGMFNLTFFHARVDKKDIVFVSGDVQPTSNSENYALCSKIIDMALDLGVKEVITIGGIGLPEIPDKTRVHVVMNKESIKKDLKGLNVVFDGNETVKLILGATGLLLGIAKLKDLNAFSLLAETLNQPKHVGVKEAREVLKVLMNYLGFKLDFADLDREIKVFEEEILEEAGIDKLKGSVNQGYIG